MEAYKIAFHLSNEVWNIVIGWEWFEKKKTVGSQSARAVDSISANIAEGFGRFFKENKIKFYWYAQGSAKESFDWNEKSKIRNLLKQEQHNHIFSELENLPKKSTYSSKTRTKTCPDNPNNRQPTIIK